MNNQNGIIAKRMVTTVLTSGIATILSFLISFFLTPYITNELGVEAYGFVTLAKTFTQYATIITIALNSYAGRYVTISYHKNNLEKAQEYMSSVFYGDVAISAIIMTVAFAFILVLEAFLNISAELVASVKLLFLFVFLSFVITTVGTSFTAVAYAKNRLDIVGLFRGLSYVVEIVFYIIVFRFVKPAVWQVGVAIFLAQTVVVLGNLYVYKKYTPEIKIKHKYVSINAIKTLVVNGVWNSINSLGNTLNSGLDLMATNLWLSELAMGQISITKTISGIFMSFNQLLAQPFQPLFLKSYSDGDKQKLVSELKLSMKVSGLFSSVAFAGFFALGKCFYTLWIPGQDIDLIYGLTVVTMLALVVEGPIHPLYYIYTLTVKNKIPCIITVIGGVLNVCSMAVLIKYSSLGIYSIVLTTTVIMTFINTVTNPIYMTHCLKVKWYTFYPALIKSFLSCACMSVACLYISGMINPKTWVEFAFSAIICGIVGCITHLIIVFSKSEKSMLLVMIRNRVRK